MKLQIERPYVESLVERFPDLTTLSEQLKFGNRAEIPFYQLSFDQLGHLKTLYETAGPRLSCQAAQW